MRRSSRSSEPQRTKIDDREIGQGEINCPLCGELCQFRIQFEKIEQAGSGSFYRHMRTAWVRHDCPPRYRSVETS